MTNIIFEIDGNEVSCGSGFGLEERNKYYNNPELIVNKLVTIKYFEKCSDSKTNLPSLRFPIFKGIKITE